MIKTKCGSTDETYMIEGNEYIFEYPSFGPGWFVLRCHHGEVTAPHTFDRDPLAANRALDHFNDPKAYNCHDTSKRYTLDEIVMNFGYRGECFPDVELRVHQASRLATVASSSRDGMLMTFAIS
jgi:hypothetical protein